MVEVSNIVVVHMNLEDELRDQACQVEHSNGEHYGSLVLPIQDLVVEINIRTNEEPRPIFVS